MSEHLQYDVAIIGGGLAGLSLSIQMAGKGYNVALFEKENYPFHKVCGEYISLESWDFLESIGMKLSEMNLPIIKQLIVSSPDGNVLTQALPLGGFGVSRYLADNELKKIALNAGVKLYEGCKAEDILFENDGFTITTNKGIYDAKVCCGSFGKRSNIDVKLKRDFMLEKAGKLNNFIGVKYHIKTAHPVDTIALHNFENGYCGISKIEEEKYCLCYLTNAANLKNNNNSIRQMEKNVLYKNIHLQKIFTECEMLYKQPATISQISFSKKKQVEDHVVMLGDAAGMITPLCGNGMSMALHSSKIAASCIDEFLKGKTGRTQMETDYIVSWQNIFAKRLTAGRIIQSLFGKPAATNIFIGIMKRMPFVTRQLIKLTHGERF